MSVPTMPSLATDDPIKARLKTRHMRHASSVSHGSHLSPSESSEPALSELEGDLAADFSLTDSYTFGRAYHLFTEHTKAVPTIRFANQNRDLLCFASLDGGITLTSAASQPQVIKRMRDHTRGVTDFDWSSSNEWVLSAALDSSLRLWDVSAGKCLRIIYDDDQFTACRFHPVNNNIVIGGTSKDKLKVFNVSTGKCVQKFSLPAAVTAMCFEPSGAILFVGDAKGYVVVFQSDTMSGSLRQLSKTSVCSKAITSLDFSRWQGKTNAPSLLVSACDSTIRLMGVKEPSGDLFPKKQAPIAQRQASVRSQFCPLVAHKTRGTCVVTGSEDMTVQILDIESATRPVVTRLVGHNATVLGVSWAYDETLLASSDSDGIVMLWRREVSAE